MLWAWIALSAVGAIALAVLALMLVVFCFAPDPDEVVRRATHHVDYPDF